MMHKYSRPTSYDHAPYQEIWLAELENSVEHYIQVSEDLDKPHWCELGLFLKTAVLSNAVQNDWDQWMHWYKSQLPQDSTMFPWSR